MSALTAFLDHDTNQYGLECCNALSTSEMGQSRLVEHSTGTAAQPQRPDLPAGSESFRVGPQPDDPSRFYWH
jgi:hypothetical protein